ncbi:hypothetical protein SAMN05444274_12012 [Mariniphaga anaerophila]|uniref:Uncharacterized protein n=1 Tax=Mariniphaga anaerophila TaxID=1484053 RepID=A0A1M5GEP1_9BACT|nr:DUF5677 domain-containing protein [Mariniphaga anaerophila]SHG02203.1 hypothetical protein SAMN05444274_12012 [Mariniphaga anaerophila]
MNTEALNEILYSNPLQFYEMLLLGPLGDIYTARKETQLNEWQSYSNLLIDKFAIHSSTFFHISSGIIEHKKSGETRKLNGYDLFTVNTTIRVMIETYIAFNHLFVEPNSEEEKYFRFLLWELDGLFQEKKYDVELSDFDGVETVLASRDAKIDSKTEEIKNSDFIKEIPENELKKIFDSAKRKSDWKFLFENGRIRPLKIIELVKHCCKMRAFVNTYKHSSIHTHSNFPAIEEFKRLRGKLISKEYTDPITRLAIYLTCLFIYDICEIDKNAKKRLGEMPPEINDFIIGMSISIKKND